MKPALITIQITAPQVSTTDYTMDTIDAMDIVHDSDMSVLDDPAASIDHSAFANPHALDLPYQRWNSLCTVQLVRFMQTLTSTAVDRLSKSEEILQREFTEFLIRDLKLMQNAEFLSLKQRPADPSNLASASTSSLHSVRSASSQSSTSTASSQVSDGEATNRIQREVTILVDHVEKTRGHLEKREGASGALRKDRLNRYLKIAEPEVAKLTKTEKTLRDITLAAHTLHQVLLDAQKKLSSIWIDAQDLGFSGSPGTIDFNLYTNSFLRQFRCPDPPTLESSERL
jgi:hypothetical protein